MHTNYSERYHRWTGGSKTLKSMNLREKSKIQYIKAIYIRLGNLYFFSAMMDRVMATTYEFDFEMKCKWILKRTIFVILPSLDKQFCRIILLHRMHWRTSDKYSANSLSP